MMEVEWLATLNLHAARPHSTYLYAQTPLPVLPHSNRSPAAMSKIINGFDHTAEGSLLAAPDHKLYQHEDDEEDTFQLQNAVSQWFKVGSAPLL